MPLHGILEVELFDVWGINFVGPFPSLFSNKYILIGVEYVRVVVKFLKKYIFTRCGTLRAIITDRGSHFYNQQSETLLKKYEVTQKVATP